MKKLEGARRARKKKYAKNSVIILSVLFALALGQVTDPVQDTGIRCSVNIPTVPTAHYDCIDVSTPGQIASNYTLASNDTRIEKDGLRICGPAAPPSAKQPLNVVFVVDMSGSMWGVDCGNCENDPNFDAPKAVAAAITSIRDSIPGSLIGFEGFSAGVCDGTYTGDDAIGAGTKYDVRGTPASNTVVNPIPVDAQANVDILLAQTNYDINNYYFSCGTNGGGTWYFSPLKKALDMLASVRVGNEDHKEIIIFVTDGDPNGGSDLDSFDSLVTAVVDNGDAFPETYAIFINGNNNDLRDLARASGTEDSPGGLIELDNANEIAAVLDSIVATNIFNYDYQTTVTYDKGGLTVRDTAVMNFADTSGGINQGEIGLILPNIIPLALGSNTITVTTTSAGVDHTNVVTLNLTGPPRLLAQNFAYGDPNPFEDVCEAAAKITFSIPGNTDVSVLGTDQHTYNVNLTNGPGDSTMITLGKDPGDGITVNQTPGTSHFIKEDTLMVGGVTYTYLNPDDPRDVATNAITKSVGPELVSIVKHPGNFQQYKVSETGEILTLPDTLIVTIQNPLGVANPLDTALWNTLILFTKNETCNDVPFSAADSTYDTQQVVSVSLLPDGSYQVLINGERDATNIETGDCAVLNPSANIHNLTVNPGIVPVTGEDSRVSLIESGIVTPVIGLTAETDYKGVSATSYMIPVIDASGTVVRHDPQARTEYWIPPIGLTADGEIDENAQKMCMVAGSDQTPKPLPFNCFSKVAVYSHTGYVADIDIYDHLGKVVHHSTQRFGMDGCRADIDAPGRLLPAGYLSFLVWNQRGLEGTFVGSGVYIWKVVYNFADGTQQFSLYKQGVVRDLEPVVGCHNL